MYACSLQTNMALMGSDLEKVIFAALIAPDGSLAPGGAGGIDPLMPLLCGAGDQAIRGRDGARVAQCGTGGGFAGVAHCTVSGKRPVD